MNMFQNQDSKADQATWYSKESANLDEFTQLLKETTTAADVPYAIRIEKNIPIYKADSVRDICLTAEGRRSILSEFGKIFLSGAGAIVITGAYQDTSVIDTASKHFENIIAKERETGSGGDHFAKPGANDRIWNSFQKLCEEDPTCFAHYFCNDMIALASEAWLGPNYRMTSQVNQVRPGGEAQQAHRDYHLGFMPGDSAAKYPPHIHDLSAALTLQGGIAHCDMSLESGPTKLLPFSQKYRAGYVAYTRPDFQQEFEKRHVQLPMDKGDLLFFNPALFHAAGANKTKDFERLVNLLQVSSTFGVPIETIDHMKICKAVYPALKKAKSDETLTQNELENIVTCAADTYAFPTSLDNDPPIGGLAPRTQKDITLEALEAGWSIEEYTSALNAQNSRRNT
ncbi:MAG: phytanoyl-CoA dioxygenase family protein [Hyphomicrobiales bacterium]